MRIKSSVIATSLPGNDHYRLSFKFQTKIKSSSAKRVGIKFVPAVSICRAGVYSTRWTSRHEVHHMSEPLRVLWLISKLMVITQVCRYCDFHFDPRVPPFSTRVYTPHPSKSDGHCRSNVPKNNVYALSCCSTLQTFRTIEIMRCWFFDSIPLRNYFFKKNCYPRYSYSLFFFFLINWIELACWNY